MCVCVICGWQWATAALGMFTLQNAITAQRKQQEARQQETDQGAGHKSVDVAKQNNIWLPTHAHTHTYTQLTNHMIYYKN